MVVEVKPEISMSQNVKVKPGLYRVDHADGTASFLGYFVSSKPLAYRMLSQPSSESEIVTKVASQSLPFMDEPNVIGWGGFSICLRVVGTNGRPYAAVLRCSQDVSDLDLLKARWDREDEVNRMFEPYTIPQNFIVVSGVDNRPTAVKISPEVPGANLPEVSPLYLFINQDLVRQHLDFSKKAMGVFLKRGLSLELIGHAQGNAFKNILERYTPSIFNSSNLMIDFQKNRLVLIDCEASGFDRKSIRANAQFLARTVTRGAEVIALGLLEKMHNVRNVLFREVVDKKTVDNSDGIDQFKEGFKHAVNLFNDFGVNNRVIGSFSLAASINKAGGEYYLTPRRINGTTRDVDFLILDQDPSLAIKLAKQLNDARRANLFYPEISLTILEKIGEHDVIHNKRARILPVVMSGMSFDSYGNLFLTVGDVREHIPEKYLDPLTVDYEGTEFSTLEPKVLAGLYLTRMGIFRSKDIAKVATLLDLTQVEIPGEFLKFAHNLRTKNHPLYRNFLIRELIYHFSGGHIRGGLFHSMKATFFR